MYKTNQKKFISLPEKEKVLIIEQLENSIENQKEKYFQTFIQENNDDQSNLNSLYKNKVLKNIKKENSAYFLNQNLINNNNNNNNSQNNLSLSSSSSESKNQKLNIIKKAENAVISVKNNIKQISKIHNINLNKSNENNSMNNRNVYDSPNVQEIYYNFESPLNSNRKENNIKNYYCGKNDNDIKFENNEIKSSIENENIICYNYEDENESETNNSNNKYDNIADISKIDKNEKGSIYDITNSKDIINLENEYEDEKISLKPKSTLRTNLNDLNDLNPNIFNGEAKKYLNVISKKYKPKYKNNKNNIIKNRSIQSKISHKKITKNSDFKKLSNKNINRLNTTYKTLTHKKINTNDVTNRLYYNYKKMSLNKTLLKNKIEQEELKSCSFKPKINLKSKLMMENKNQNLFERNAEFEAIKQENISKRRHQIEEKYESIGHPKINSKSKIIALMNRQKEKDDNYFPENQKTFNRLYRNPKTNTKKEFYDNELKECTFKPELNHTNYVFNDNNENDDIVKENNYNINYFLERQKNFEEQKKEKNFERIIDLSNKIYTFKPSINRNDRTGLINNYSISENNKSCNIFNQYNRLYNDAQIVYNRKKFLENFYNSQYTFNPKINEYSKVIGESRINQSNNTNVFSKSSNDIKINDNSGDECTFKPSLYYNKKYNNKESYYKNFDKIIEKINEEKAKKKEIVKKYQEFQKKKEMAECKFIPEINKKIPNYNENNIHLSVKGVNKYLEQVEKFRQDRKTLEHKRQNSFYNKTNKFNLTNNNKMRKYDLAIKEN